MQTLLQYVLKILKTLKVDPVTAAEALAVMGFLALCAGVLGLVSRGSKEAGKGANNVSIGCGQLISGIILLFIAAVLAMAAIVLAYGTLIHIQN